MAEFIVYKTDDRTYYLERLLAGCVASRRTHVFAPNVVIDKNLIKAVSAGEVIVGGRADDEAISFMSKNGILYHNMLTDEDFQAVNSRLTAEGTLGVILSHSKTSLRQINALVIGFGRTGAATVKLLNDVGVGLTIATNGSPRPSRAFGKVINASSFDFSPYDVVINTVPVRLIEDKEILSFKPSAIYIDLASKAGLNLPFAKYLGIDADLYPALPAKCAPKSAAEAIKKYIDEVTK